MKKVILLLCLGLIGCAMLAKESGTLPRIIERPVVVEEAELDGIISVFSEALEKNPNYTGAYYNRAIAYFYKKDYDQCWQDVHISELLGCRFTDKFLRALRKASEREQ